MADPLDQLNELRTIRHLAPEPVARLRERIATRRRRRHLVLIGSFTAAVAAGLVLVTVPDESQPNVQTVDDPTPDGSSTSEGAPGAVSSVLPDGSVISGEAGIEIVVGRELSRLSDAPTAMALSVGDGVVVAQRAETGAVYETGDVYPPQPTGPVLVLEDGATRELNV